MTEDVVTVTLPVWLPLTNLALSLVTMAALGYLTIRSWRAGKMHGTVTLLRATLVWAAVAVIVGGALSQLGLMSTEVWTVVGLGGRIVVTIALLTIATVTKD